MPGRDRDVESLSNLRYKIGGPSGLDRITMRWILDRWYEQFTGDEIVEVKQLAGRLLIWSRSRSAGAAESHCFAGGPRGAHRILGDRARAAAHWQGYCENARKAR